MTWLDDKSKQVDEAEEKKFENYLTLECIREYLSVMKDEPEGWKLMSEFYHEMRRILGDE